MGDWIGELLMNWEVIDTKASKLTMEEEDFLYNLWVDVEKSSIIRLVQQNSKLGLSINCRY